MSRIKISELAETLNLDSDSMFPVVFHNETRKIRFETIRDILTELSSDYNEKSGNIITIYSNIENFATIAVKSTTLKIGDSAEITISGKNAINAAELRLNDKILESTLFRIIDGQFYTFNAQTDTLEKNWLQWRLEFYDADAHEIEQEAESWFDLADFTTTPSNAKFAKLFIRYNFDYRLTDFTIDDLFNIQLELGESPTDYEQFKESQTIGATIGSVVSDIPLQIGTNVIYSDNIKEILLKVGYLSDSELSRKISQLISTVNALNDSKADRSEIPDVSEFITKAVNDLINYYKKSETYNKEEVNDLIAKVNSLKMKIVAELPTTDISTDTIYLKRLANVKDKDIYQEYVYIDNEWEKIGTTDVDLSHYITDEMLATELESVKEVFVGNTMPTNTGWKIWIDESADEDEEEIISIAIAKLGIPRKTSELDNDSIKGGEVIEIGSYQFVYDGKVLPAIPVTALTEAYQKDKSGVPITLHWTLYGNENNLKIVSSDLIAGTYSVDVLIHNQFHCAYEWTESSTGIINPAIQSQQEIGFAEREKGGIVKLGNGLYLDEANKTMAYTLSIESYLDAPDKYFIGKGTLENVLNDRIGSVETALDTILGKEY